MADLIGYLKSVLRLSGKRSTPLSFSLLFDHFKEVLDSNNRALEIITDMGEKLGGEYLFDITYVRNAYERLSQAVQNSIRGLGILTRNRYPRIHDAYSRIDGQIRRMAYSSAFVFKEPVVFYDQITWDLTREVGGKNASLAELKNHLKLNVPDAFAVTSFACETFISHNRLDEKIHALGEDPSGAALQELQERILTAEIPPAVHQAIHQAVERMKSACGKDVRLAVRSSAEEEDAEFSFAGQFETVLNVPLNVPLLEEAYKKVISSLFSAHAAAYQKRLGYVIGKLRMAVGCVVMVDAAVSGVMYTTHPHGGKNTLLINATWGLGRSIVEGQTDADSFTVEKDGRLRIVDQKIGKKDAMIIALKESGVAGTEVPVELRLRPSLTEEQITELARVGILIEKHYRRPQDIEWAIGRNGRIFMLQSRPLRISETARERTGLPVEPVDADVLIQGKGLVVQRGIAAGRVFILKRLNDLEAIPKGAVLVARHDASNFVRVMPYVSAIITDTGSLTSHMASLCREFKIPTVVNTGNATVVLQDGREITVHADEENHPTIYNGVVRPLLEYAEVNSVRMEEVYEFRMKTYILRYIAPLNLIDPLTDDFSPEGCRTLHDILRFIHEKSIGELVEGSGYGSPLLKKQTAVKLELPIPAGILVMDIGGGLNPAVKGFVQTAWDDVISVPLKAVLKGMMHPGVWHTDAVSLGAGDFFSSMVRMPDITTESMNRTGYNIAIASEDYLNLSLRFGYHFSVLDCYCSKNTRNNHIYFRFVGGATDITKRSRRIHLIANIMKEYGFSLKTKGDLIIARLTGLRQEEEEKVLEEIGRLISYTRQLDTLLKDDQAVEHYTRKFLDGDYTL